MVAGSGGIYNRDIYVVNSDGSDFHRVTDDVAYDVDPTWSPDGSAIAFSREGALLTVLANGSDETPLPAPGQHPEWSPFLR